MFAKMTGNIVMVRIETMRARSQRDGLRQASDTTDAESTVIAPLRGVRA